MRPKIQHYTYRQAFGPRRIITGVRVWVGADESYGLAVDPLGSMPRGENVVIISSSRPRRWGRHPVRDALGG